MKSTTLSEVLVVVAVAAGLAIVHNLYFAKEKSKIDWVYAPRPVGSVVTDTSFFTTSLPPDTVKDIQQPTTTATTGISPDSAARLAKLEFLKKDSLKAAKVRIADSLAKLRASTLSIQPSQQTSSTREDSTIKLPVPIDYNRVVSLLKMPNVTFIDARKTEEHNKGHFPGSKHVDIQAFQGDPAYRGQCMQLLYSLPKDQPVVAYCGGGNCELSHELCDELIRIGFKKVCIYLGGWNEYSEKQGLKK